MEQPTSGDRRDRGLGPSGTTSLPRHDQDIPQRDTAANDTTQWTFLLTDIVGSVPLWEQDADAMQRALLRHDTIIGECVTRYGGTVVHQHGEGDSRFAVFAHAGDAIPAAYDLQRAFQHEAWATTTPLHVRVALHTGETIELAGHFYGPAVNRCARLRGLAHGGQVVLSEATAGLVRGTLPADAALLDLGGHPLRGFERPEQVYQLVHPDLPADFPPLVGTPQHEHNLPAHPTPLIGREKDVERVCDFLRHDDVRLVTLTGPGGVGKTRLALQVAADLLDHFPDGVFLVPLAPISDPELVISAIAQALELRELGGRPLQDTVKDHLKSRQQLLLFDNFEQVLPAAPIVAELLTMCARLKVLVTSRSALHLRGEQDVSVHPLPCPDPKPALVETLMGCAAIKLFVQRAAGVKEGFSLTEEDAPAVAEICRRVDGLPLGIELAAASVRLLSPQAMLARLERRLPLLTSGARDLPARQRTLRDTIAWSYDLLSVPEQRLFRRLAVFVGGCSLTAVEAVCGADVTPAANILDMVARLMDQSLVQQHSGADGEPRFTMLETVREYGLEQLAASGETETYRMRHAEYMVRLSEEAEPHLWSLTRRAWLTRLAHDLENIRAALAWSETAPGRIELGLRLAGNLYWFWRLGIHWREIRVWLESVLARTDASELTAPRAKALWCLGMHSYFLGDLVTARSRFEESVEIWRRLGEKPGLARALSALGLVRRIQGDYTARSLQEEAVAICRELGDRPATARALFMLGSAPGTPDDHVRAREALSESAALNRGLGDPWALAPVLLMLGIGAYQRGDYAEARPHFDEALGVFREVNDRWHLARTLQGLGQLERAEGNDLSAWTQFREALTLYQELAVPAGIANCLAGCAGDARSRPERRVHLLAAADALWEALGVHLDPVDRAEVDREVGAARMMLGEAAFATAWAEGRAMTPEQAIAYAMEGSGSA